MNQKKPEKAYLVPLNDEEAQHIYEGLHVLVGLGVEAFKRAVMENGEPPREVAEAFAQGLQATHALAHRFDTERYG